MKLKVTHKRIYGVCLLFTCCTTFILLPDSLIEDPVNFFWGWRDDDFQLNRGQNEIIILSWTRYWDSHEKVSVRTSKDCSYIKPFKSKENSVSAFNVPCRITHDKRYLKSSDGLLFHSWDLQHINLPSWKSDKQIWIYLQQESPIYTKLNLSKYPNIFDWTMTYRRDSDVYHPYSQIEPLGDDDANRIAIEPQWKNRTNLVAWIVSDAESNSTREKLADELKKFIPVNVYGRIGMPCPESEDCYSFASATHKFYLALENSLCVDYITEKFFHALETNMVPVVYGGYNSSDYADIAPKGSYIDARDFLSVKDLADYLIYLDKNDEEYEKYFEWKRKYKVVSGQGWCNLCQRLFEERLHPRRERKQYADLLSWWNLYDSSSICLAPIQRLTSF